MTTGSSPFRQPWHSISYLEFVDRHKTSAQNLLSQTQYQIRH